MIYGINNLLDKINFFYKTATINVPDAVSNPVIEFVTNAYYAGIIMGNIKVIEKFLKKIKKRKSKYESQGRLSFYNEYVTSLENSIKKLEIKHDNLYQSKLKGVSKRTEGENIIYSKVFTLNLSDFGPDFIFSDELLDYRKRVFTREIRKKNFTILINDNFYKNKSRQEINEKVEELIRPTILAFEAKEKKLKKVNKIIFETTLTMGPNVVLNGEAITNEFSSLHGSNIHIANMTKMISPTNINIFMNVKDQKNDLNQFQLGAFTIGDITNFNVEEKYLLVTHQIIRHELGHLIQYLIKEFKLMNPSNVGGLGPRETIELRRDVRGLPEVRERSTFLESGYLGSKTVDITDPQTNIVTQVPVSPQGEFAMYQEDKVTSVNQLKVADIISKYSLSPSMDDILSSCLKILNVYLTPGQTDDFLNSLTIEKINELYNNAMSTASFGSLPNDPFGNRWESRSQFRYAINMAAEHLKDFVEVRRTERISSEDPIYYRRSRHEYRDIEYQTRLKDAVWSFKETAKHISSPNLIKSFFKVFTNQTSKDQLINDRNKEIYNKEKELGRELFENEENDIMPKYIIDNPEYLIVNSSFKAWKDLSPPKYQNALKILYLEGLSPLIN